MRHQDDLGQLDGEELPGCLPPCIRQVLRMDLDGPKRKNMRRILIFLALRPGQKVSARELGNLVEGNPDRVPLAVLSQLVRMTETHRSAFGFRVFSEGEGSQRRFSLSVESPEAIARSRRLAIVTTTADEVPITEKMRARVSSLLEGLAISREVPTPIEVTRLLNNSDCLNLGGQEEAFIRALVERARRQVAVRVEVLFNDLGIPIADSRLTRNLKKTTMVRAPEVGFVIDTVAPKYTALFFVDPEARRKAIHSRHGHDQSVTDLFFDPAGTFSPRAFSVRLNNAEDLSETEKGLVRAIAEGQVKGAHKTNANLREEFEVSTYALKQLRKKIELRREEFGFKINMRTDQTWQCVLLDYR